MVFLCQLPHTVVGSGVVCQVEKVPALQGFNLLFLALNKLVVALLIQADGENVPPGLALLGEQVHHLENGSVALGVVHIQGVVDYLIHDMVAGQHIALAVPDLAPGGVDLHGVGAVADGLLLKGLAVDDLPVEQLQLENGKAEYQEQHQGRGAAYVEVR